MTPHGQTLVAAATIARRLVAEVERAEEALLRVEDSIAPLITQDSPAVASHALQDIDLVVQSLADIARCLDGLSRHLPPLVVVDAQTLLAPLRLDDVVRRLSGKPVVPLPPDARIALF